MFSSQEDDFLHHQVVIMWHPVVWGFCLCLVPQNRLHEWHQASTLFLACVQSHELWGVQRKGMEWEKERPGKTAHIYNFCSASHECERAHLLRGTASWRKKKIPKTSPSCLAYSMLFTSRCGSRLSTRSGKYLSVYFLAASLLFFSMYINKRGRRVVHMCGMEGAVDSAGASWMPHSWLTSSVRANVNQ